MILMIIVVIVIHNINNNTNNKNIRIRIVMLFFLCRYCMLSLMWRKDSEVTSRLLTLPNVRMDKLVLAANQGNIEAQCNLGVCYENGDGVLKDPLKKQFVIFG